MRLVIVVAAAAALSILTPACSSSTSSALPGRLDGSTQAASIQSSASTLTSTSQETLYVASEEFAADPFSPAVTDIATVVQSFNAITGASNSLAQTNQSQTDTMQTSDHGRFLYLASNGIAVEDTITGKTTFYDQSDTILSSAKSGDGNTLFFTDGSEAVYVFDGMTGVPTKTYTIANGGPIAANQTGSELYVANPARSAVTVVNAASGQTHGTITFPGAITVLRVNTGYQELFALAQNDRKAYIAYLKTNKYVGYILEPATQPMTNISFNDGTGTLFLGGGTMIEKYIINNAGVPQPRATYHLSSSLAGSPGLALAVDLSQNYLYAMTGNNVASISTATGAISRTFIYPSSDSTTSYNPVGISLAQ